MEFVRTAAGAELLEFKPTRVVSLALLARVIPLTALCALERDHRAIDFGFLRHDYSPFLFRRTHRATQELGGPGDDPPAHQLRFYSMIEVTTPAPTVRPPSRIANRSPSSIATGVINSTVIWMLSPGITISVPSGSPIDPVTSVVRM